jgi:predicted phosphohydrolase
MKIIHLSDTHIGHGDCDLQFRKIVDDLTLWRPCDPERHIVVHTGDLVDRASDSASLDRAHRLLSELRSFGYRILLCPGNHDYGNNLAMSTELAGQFQSRFREFIFPKGEAVFPTLHIAGDCAFIGLDSNHGELNWHDRLLAEGEFGREQLERLDELLTRQQELGRRIVLYFHHHPFPYGFMVTPGLGEAGGLGHWIMLLTRSFRRLKDAFGFNQTVRDRARLLLFGHMHFGLDCRAESGKYGIPLAFDGSSSTGKDMPGKSLRYRIVDLDTLSAETRFLQK